MYFTPGRTCVSLSLVTSRVVIVLVTSVDRLPGLGMDYYMSTLDDVHTGMDSLSSRIICVTDIVSLIDISVVMRVRHAVVSQYIPLTPGIRAQNKGLLSDFVMLAKAQG